MVWQDKILHALESDLADFYHYLKNNGEYDTARELEEIMNTYFKNWKLE